MALDKAALLGVVCDLQQKSAETPPLDELRRRARSREYRRALVPQLTVEGSSTRELESGGITPEQVAAAA